MPENNILRVVTIRGTVIEFSNGYTTMEKIRAEAVFHGGVWNEQILIPYHAIDHMVLVSKPENTLANDFNRGHLQ